MNKNQRWAMFSVAAMALFALPVYLIIALLTIPIGVGLLMLTSSSPWVLKLYPFVFAGYGHWKSPHHYLETALSLPLTIVQWALISWVASIFLREFRGRKLILAAFAVLVIVAVATSAVLSVADIKLVWPAAYT